MIREKNTQHEQTQEIEEEKQSETVNDFMDTGRIGDNSKFY